MTIKARDVIRNGGRFMLNESGINRAEYCKKVVSGRNVSSEIRFLVNARSS